MLEQLTRTHTTHTHTLTCTHATAPQVFPALYLPVMEEANSRVLRPYRMYLPLLPEWWRFRSRMAALDSFLKNYFRHAQRRGAGGMGVWGRDLLCLWYASAAAWPHGAPSYRTTSGGVLGGRACGAGTCCAWA